MSSSKTKKFGFLAAGVALLSLAAVQGCSSDDDSQAQPTAGSGPTAGSSGKTVVEEGGAAGSTTGPTGGTGGTSSGGEAGITGSEAGTAGTAGEAGAAGAPATLTCDDGQANCFCGAPSTAAQFANGCVSGGCPSTFDNSKLTQIAKVGTL